MATRIIVAAVMAALVVTAAAGVAIVATEPGEEPATEPAGAWAAPEAPALEIFNLTWDGFYKLGLADCAMIVCPAHTYETEPLVEPLAKAGVKVAVPANVSVLEFEVRWTGSDQLHLMIHGPMKPDSSMPSYMAMEGTGGHLCIAIPNVDIVAGTWEVMVHADSPGYQETMFTIHINGQGADKASLLSEYHGHPVQEEWSMDMRQGAACR